MRKQTNRMCLLGAAAMLAFALSWQPGVSARVGGARALAAVECAGDACGQVTLTFDEQ